MTLSSSQLIAAGRVLEAPFEVELELSGELKVAQCLEVLRLVPGRRVVARMVIDGETFLGKLFLGSDASKYCLREKNGVEALHNAGIKTAPLVGGGRLHDRGGEALLMEYLPNISHLSALAQPSSESGNELLCSAVEMLAKLHDNGLEHQDCHLDNFLVADQALYLVDGDAVKQRNQLTDEQALRNLALFFVQLPLFLMPQLPELIRVYCRCRGWHSGEIKSQLDVLVRQQRADRQRRFLKKIYRDCTQFKVDQSKSRFVVVDRAEESEELTDLIDHLDEAIAASELLKDGNSATVAKVVRGNRSFVVKRYNMKSLSHRLKRCLQPSRAWLSWRNAQLLCFYGVATPKPLAMVEQRVAGLRGKAYFITDYVEAPSALAFVEQVGDVEQTQWLAQQFKLLFSLMRLLSISHGDFKESNFLVKNDALCVIDLDSMQLHHSEKALMSALAKDGERFMKNWSADPRLSAMMSQALSDISP